MLNFKFVNDNKEYIYRPISLGKTSEDILPGEIGFNAFPNRKAGSNWIGYEEFIHTMIIQ